MWSAPSGVEWSASLRRAGRDELDEWLRFAQRMVDAADGIAMRAFRGKLEVSTKDDGSFVTQADRAIEHMVREAILATYPGHGLVGEEYGAAESAGQCRWYIDPIDGTHNFMRHVPVFGTLIAVECEGELQAGVVSAPALGRRWWASRGGGAWVREPGGRRPRRLIVSGIDDVARSQVLYRSLLDMRASRVAEGFDTLLGQVWRERGYGDFWGYMLVADGAAELMVEQDLGPWDLAAPWIIVEEAGGRVTDFDGRRGLRTGEGMASNGLLHEAFLEALWQWRRDPSSTPGREPPMAGVTSQD